MATKSLRLFWLLSLLEFCVAWMDERPVLESRDGNLFISAAKDRNITLKILGDGYVNVNEINLLHVATAAESATRLIERWRTGYLAEVESNLQRLTQIVEGPEGLERRMAMMKGFGEGNSSLTPGISSSNQSIAGVKIRMIAHRVRRVEEKVKSIEAKLKINECSSNPCLNGGTCQDLYGGYQCNCPSNWEGPNCMVDVNECVRLLGTDLGCQNGATCHNLPGSYRCDCTPGWFGLHCTKKTSICNTQNSNELCGHGVCVSKPGSLLGYTCICDQGWQADGTNPACIKDVDECAGNHRPCSVNPWVECRNAPGTFFCDSCPRGYTGNGYYCTDIDECQQDNGGCSTSPRVQCINTMGSRMCGPCPTGYRGDGVTCIYVGSCAINNGGCHPLATCVQNPALTSAYVICRCPAGMGGDGIGPNGCQSSTIVTVHSCAGKPCVHGRCIASGNGYTCACEAGYTGISCNIATNPCEPNPCKNNGVCTISGGQVACDCPSMYTGNRCETARQTCGGVSRNPVGHLAFPMGGNVYQHGLSCAWVLVTNSSLVLNVTFTRFNLEQSTDCKYDFLQIHDGRNAGSQMIGRFCGNTLPNTNGSIVSSHNSLYFWFHSDSSISHDGFALQWNSIKPVCGGLLTNDYGTISSPGSPGRYPPNRDCYWQINVKPSKRIQIHFGQLMLEEHPTCGADFLEIRHEERLGLYCNHTHPPALVVPGSQAVIHFHSDSAGQDAGFQIHYSAIEGIPGCNDVYTAPTGTISTPMNMNNLEEIECEWTIQMPAGERVQITWPSFELPHARCQSEHVEIYDGPSTESPLIERYCGPNIPPTITSTSNVVLVVFKSNRMDKGTFTLFYTMLCGGVFTEESGIILSPESSVSKFQRVTCIYEIKQPPNRKIVLHLLYADVRGARMPDCFPNYLRIFDGPNDNTTRLADICGLDSVLPEDDRIYYSTHNVMFLKFSGVLNINAGRGFMANYTTIQTRCGGIYTESTGTIRTPSEDGRYLDDEECIWTIQAPVGHAIMLTWLSFELEQTVRCRYDYVKIYENYMTSNKELVATFCGSKKPPVVMTQSNTMTIVFHADSTISHEGFIATYIFVDATKVCGGHYIKMTGVIRSPNYPHSYPNKKECVWVIEAPSKQRIILNVKKFALEQHFACTYDFLEIRNGGYETSPLVGKFCGNDIPTEIISQSNQLYLKFVSDVTGTYPGFELEWDSTTMGCGGTLTAANGDIISPNYPQPYVQQADCFWKIAVAEGSLVRLLIVDLQLEHHDKCRFDYIEISEGIDRRNSQRYCANPYPKVIEAKTNMVNVRFRSDFTNSGRGFHLKYETLCENKVHGFSGVIESPNFPNKYEHNLNCSWIINAPVGNRINVSFSHFDLEGPSQTDVCGYDYLEIEEGEENIPTNQLAKLCDSGVLPPKIHSTKYQVFVKFVTDSMFAFNGFRLEWTIDGCGGHLTKFADTFTSPGYPSSYPLNVDCEWLIEVDYAHSIELTIHDINTEKEKGCFFDKLQIYSGKDDKGLKLVEVCYSTKPLVYTSFGNTMFLKFHSDMTYAARGFSASYRTIPATCGGKYTTDTGVIFSTNYPKNYPHKQNCEWLIEVDKNYVVNITFLDFDVEHTQNCTDDYVQVFDGPTRKSPLMGTHCGNQLPPSYESSSNEMLVVMRTDTVLSAKGFKAQFSKACGARIVVKDQGYLAPSGSYSSDSNEDNCSWILVAEDPADHVTVTFTHMEAEELWVYSSEDCSGNYIEVFEGEGLHGPSRGRWCDNITPLPITSNGNALTVHLYANYDFLGRFALTYSVLNSACGGTYTSYRGVIASPGYPNTYPLNVECIWILTNSPGNRLTLTFSEFDLQQSENCDLDYLEIRENSGIGKLISISCGTSIETVQTSQKLWIKFKSDGDDVGKGFKGEYTLTGGNELSGSTGRITSPLFPMPFKRRDNVFWRVTVQFGWVIRLEITDMFIESGDSSCLAYLRVYDGYDADAPVLLETCGLDIPDPVTTNSNVAYIELSTGIPRQGSYFDLNWLQIPRSTDNPFDGNTDIHLAECTEEVALMNVQNSNYDFTSPGFPNGYEPNLKCTWLFTSPPGTHVEMKILAMDLEESNNCQMDYVAVYSGNALTTSNNAKLIQQLCLANSTAFLLKADNVMTVKFITDASVNKTGFSAFVYRECGGKMVGPNGVIEIDNTTMVRGLRSWQVHCEWTIEVKPGRTIEVKFEHISIQQGPSWTCTDNYLMLKNGGEMTSPLLGVGKYCGDVAPAPLQTTGTRLYVKAQGVRSNINFKLTYREVGMECGSEVILSNKQKEWEISTPNYPNIPPPYTECIWKVMAPSKERISLHFVERFDLSNTLNCEKEYVEVRDGGTDSSKLLGRFCKDVAPSSMTSTGNVMYVHFYTDIPEPKNGFKAIFSVGDVCGGIIRRPSGVITSPNYPFFYPKNQTCVWWIVAPPDHTLKFNFLDIHLPGYRHCTNTDYVRISEKIPENDTKIDIGTYCGLTVPDVVETVYNQAVVTFKSDNFEYAVYRGFSINFTSSQEVCGGELTALQGTIKSNGYPNIATRSRYCDWRIKVPKGYQVVVNILDLDIISMPESRIGYSLSFYNDFRFRSRIKVIGQNSTIGLIKSSSNTMMIGFYSSPGYRGFKLRYYASAPAPCGGVIKEMKGNLTGPKVPPFNESSYFCQWSIEAPDSLMRNNNSELVRNGYTLSIMVTGIVGGLRGSIYSKFCYNQQFISLAGVGMICGNFTEPVYVRSPKPVNELTILNGTYGKPMSFNLQYQWQPCGGILEGLTHVIKAPKNIPYPINCAWFADYPGNGEMIRLHFNKLHLGGCDKNYITVRNGGPYSPELAKFCGNVQVYNITSTSNQLWIEYTAAEEPNDFEFIVEPANSGCGGALRGNSREITSPKFPSQYPNNAECTWEITADNGYHIGLVFVDRFHLESSTNCEKDYVQVFNWVKETNGSSGGMWQDLGKVCGRNTPAPFNSTGNRMKVTFHSNEAIQGDGFRAVWNENCGGVFEVTSRPQLISSPSYPNFYQPNLFCNYTLVAANKDIIVQFTEFQVELSRKDCRFDNLTIKYEQRYSAQLGVWCGESKPPAIRSTSAVEIIFRTDKYIQRSGFVFKYFLNECGGTITKPTEIGSLMNDGEYFGGMECVWKITAPSDRNVVVRFEKFELQYIYRCVYDNVKIYDGLEDNDEKMLATLCGNLTEHLPVLTNNSNSMRIEFYADENRQYGGFKAKILFVKSAKAGCGGTINMTSTQSQTFRTQQSATYDSLEDCHWKVVTELGKNIKFTINSMDVRNATNRTATDSECTGDFIEVRDGGGPFAELFGRYCGNRPPLPILSGFSVLWIRFVSDGTLEGAGVIGTLETVDAQCMLAPAVVNDTKHVLISPNYPGNYEPGVRCRWILKTREMYVERMRIKFLDFDLAESHLCDDEYLQITDTENRKYIEQGFGEDFIWNGRKVYENNDPPSHWPITSYKYCGNSLPDDYYSYSTEIEVSFKAGSVGHKGFKLEYGTATCDRNFTAEQGRIIHESISDCWITITAPANHTISLYFNDFVLYDTRECTRTSLKVFDGGFDGKLVATLCSLQTPSPIFSTGNKLSLHSWSEWHSSYEFYDITYTTTSAGRGCGGRIFNYAGSFTSPMYPNEYRNNTECSWDISVPRGLKVLLEFRVFDVGTKETCNYNYNIVNIYDVTSDGQTILATSYCGGDQPAPFEATSNRIIVMYSSSVNNAGTGWSATFKGKP